MKIDSTALSGLIGSYKTAVTEKQSVAETDSFKEALEKAASSKDLDRLKTASQEFEAYFVNTLLKEMRKTIQDGGLTEKSQARETFEGMLDEEMSKLISKKGSFGIADMIYDNMMRVYANNAAMDKIEADSEVEDEPELIPSVEE